ncbi:MAG: hypothetical protein A2566_03815 [Candidatus Zambryskibacteria bacterium RIFOXYD1_FULL_40_13]|nr:MAG: Membrane protein-like protein [Parcubacteria group bacterium GW2011_GWC1_39_12]KKR19265.1 MAG: Membrane protein-like protein [Parcubacteria group bacterium GW2011_GWF1_39_37]KKR35352.1 MAG: Membrane protein-like protein [Parcubacteria group bacterium GW2011_GWC2_40_10]KKR52216.1 MAG: Membrane protein-like protein [Parcubacteria group bacterium GW2011_GWE1_40_20]KKR65714.1 MAG: Membrane protein-like protein [Parcubacteria group bacterium GW2011_GWB1_40_5]KKR69258.1 MAG: Membrane protein
MKKPLSVDELKSARKPLRNVNIEHRERLTSLELFAVWITNKVGSMGFFVVILLWTVIWLGWNTLGPLEYRFDPYPAFVLWLFISNTIQIFLMPLLLIGQNLLGKHAEARAEAEYEIDTKAEKEIETILIHLENQNEILERLEKK